MYVAVRNRGLHIGSSAVGLKTILNEHIEFLGITLSLCHRYLITGKMHRLVYFAGCYVNLLWS